jgi:hypothetical protein
VSSAQRQKRSRKEAVFVARQQAAAALSACRTNSLTLDSADAVHSHVAESHIDFLEEVAKSVNERLKAKDVKLVFSAIEMRDVLRQPIEMHVSRERVRLGLQTSPPLKRCVRQRTCRAGVVVAREALGIEAVAGRVVQPAAGVVATGEAGVTVGMKRGATATRLVTGAVGEEGTVVTAAEVAVTAVAAATTVTWRVQAAQRAAAVTTEGAVRVA